MKEYPIVVTACFDEVTQAWLDAIRHTYFPAGRTVIGAHLTMFHAVPASSRTVLGEVAQSLCNQYNGFAIAFPELRSLGGGVAIAVKSHLLMSLRAQMAKPVHASLSPQDAQRFMPHVTIANKMRSNEAKELLAGLRNNWLARHGRIEGVALWRYLGPHWQLDARFPFCGRSHEKEPEP